MYTRNFVKVLLYIMSECGAVVEFRALDLKVGGSNPPAAPIFLHVYN